VSKVCRQFHQLIFSELFIKKYFQRSLQETIVNYLDFSDPTDYFKNTISTAKGGFQRLDVEGAVIDQKTVFIEENALFGHNLRFSEQHSALEFEMKSSKLEYPSFSISFWICRPSVLANSNLDLRFTLAPNLYLLFYTLDNGTQMGFVCHNGWMDYELQGKASVLISDSWAHFAVIYSYRYSLQFYRNGVLLASTSVDNQLACSVPNSFRLGIKSSNIRLANLAMWLKALSPMDLTVLIKQKGPLDITDVQNILAKYRIEDEVCL